MKMAKLSADCTVYSLPAVFSFFLGKTFRLSLGTGARRDPKTKGKSHAFNRHHLSSRFGCTNDVPPDNAPEKAPSPHPPRRIEENTAGASSQAALTRGRAPLPSPHPSMRMAMVSRRTSTAMTKTRIHPDALEGCDGIDNDCDGIIDPSTAEGTSVWYRDADADGYGGTTSRTAGRCAR